MGGAPDDEGGSFVGHRAVVRAADELWLDVHVATSAQPTPGLTRVAVGERRLRHAVCSVTRHAQHSIWHLAPEIPFEPGAGGLVDAANRSGRRGIEWQVVTNGASLAANPVLRTEFPGVRIAPVRFAVVVVDASVVLCAGATTHYGEPTWWLVSDTALSSRLLGLWTLTSRAAVAPGAAAALTVRQVRVARMVASGEADCAIAKALAVSQRTVVQDISVVLRYLGARTRAEAVAVLCGRALMS